MATALYDAVGQTTDSIGQRLDAMPEPQRPSRVICVVLTDGLENSSRRHWQQMVAERIEHQRTKYGWDFVFVGANQDAVLTARDLNIPQVAAMSFCAAPPQIRATIGAASAFVGARRQNFEGLFSGVDRANAMGMSSQPQKRNPGRRTNSHLFSWRERSGEAAEKFESPLRSG
jgi:hypothetical protein